MATHMPPWSSNDALEQTFFKLQEQTKRQLRRCQETFTRNKEGKTSYKKEEDFLGPFYPPKGDKQIFFSIPGHPGRDSDLDASG